MNKTIVLGWAIQNHLLFLVFFGQLEGQGVIECQLYSILLEIRLNSALIQDANQKSTPLLQCLFSFCLIFLLLLLGLTISLLFPLLTRPLMPNSLFILMEYLFGCRYEFDQIVIFYFLSNCPDKALDKTVIVLVVQPSESFEYPHQFIMKVVFASTVVPSKLLFKTVFKLILVQYFMEADQQLLQVQVEISLEILESDRVRQCQFGNVDLVQQDHNNQVQVLQYFGNLSVDYVFIQIFIVIVDVVQSVYVCSDVSLEGVTGSALRYI